MFGFKLLVAGLVLGTVAVVGLVSPVSLYAAIAPGIAGHAVMGPSGSTLNALSGPTLSTSMLRQDITGTTTSTLTPTVPMTGPLKVATAITSYFSSTALLEEVLSMHASGMGFGEIFRLFQLAALSGKGTDDILAMRESGMGWGEIAQKLGVPPGNKGNNLGAAVSGRTETGGGKPEGVGNGKPESPGNGNGNGKGNQPSVTGGNGKGNSGENRGAGGNGNGKK